MKKKLIVSILTCGLILAIGITIGITYAWFTKQSRFTSINAETGDVFLKVQINGSENKTASYSVENLAFFDIDDSDANETSHLSSMALKISVELENINSFDISYELEYTSIAKYMLTSEDSEFLETSEKGEEIYASYAYAAGLFSTESTLTVDMVNAIVNDTTQSLQKNMISGTILAGESQTIYLYIFGVQEIDSANNDFLYTDSTKKETRPYQFKLGITALKKVE